jgi:hypothetical protein
MEIAEMMITVAITAVLVSAVWLWFTVRIIRAIEKANDDLAKWLLAETNKVDHGYVEKLEQENLMLRQEIGKAIVSAQAQKCQNFDKKEVLILGRLN